MHLAGASPFGLDLDSLQASRQTNIEANPIARSIPSSRSMPSLMPMPRQRQTQHQDDFNIKIHAISTSRPDQATPACGLLCSAPICDFFRRLAIILVLPSWWLFDPVQSCPVDLWRLVGREGASGLGSEWEWESGSFGAGSEAVGSWQSAVILTIGSHFGFATLTAVTRGCWPASWPPSVRMFGHFSRFGRFGDW